MPNPEPLAALPLPCPAVGAARQALRIELRGIVQGVGLRPQVFRLARECGVSGSVRNEGTAAVVDAFGTPPALQAFETGLRSMRRGGLRIDSLLATPATLPSAPPPASFDIGGSTEVAPGLGVAPDRVLCAACAAETLDPASRRLRYPFTACTDCGPRLTVFQRTPYDRANTTMAPFPLCADCRREYADPADRRFHAQAMACPACGPKARLRRLDGNIGTPDMPCMLDAIDAAGALLDRGEILLVKGVGGYQLACDATDAAAVARLRALKRRDAKPFALLVRDLDMLRTWCEVDDLAAAALRDPAGPIVLLPRRTAPRVDAAPPAEALAPGLCTLGAMLPPTALHLLLMQPRRSPIVLTSGNLSDEPQAITLADARARLCDRVTWVLDHDRAIARRVDDSVGRVIGGRFRLMRRARGYAPAPLPVPPGFDSQVRVLALGGDLKSAFALLRDGQGLLSQHLGDLQVAASRADQQRALDDCLGFYDIDPELVACDAHPGYVSTQQARARFGERVVTVAHHHAHVAACLGEHGWPLDGPPVLGIALDGIGLGADGSFWGGEFLLADYRRAERVGSFTPVALPGGDRAAREPWRNLYAQLVAGIGWAHFESDFASLELFADLAARPRAMLDAMLANPSLAPRASSAGRLFDAVAAAVGLCRDRVAYEGEAAMRLESLVTPAGLAEDRELDYPFAVPRPGAGPGLPCIDPKPMWQALLGDLLRHTPPALIAARFHRGLAAAIVRLARLLADDHGTDTVALGGGVFQNRVLTEQVLQGLAGVGLKALLPREVPVNDGGLAWGQALVALARHRPHH